MTDYPETQSIVSKAHQVDLTIDETLLPELIHGHLGKLKELDTSVKVALGAAAQAENDAVAAREISAGRGLWHDKKKEAIEALQESCVKLAEAVQVSAKTQKISFEFQSRLAEIAKYLFNLGVRSIAANRFVVRELEMRLSGASEEKLSELARHEVILVIQQLKAQEDLLSKQERMKQVLREHESKIVQVHYQGKELEHKFNKSDARQRVHESTIEALDHAVREQLQEIATLRHQLVAQQTRVEALTNALSSAELRSEESMARVRWGLNLRTALLGIWAAASPAVVLYFLR